MNLYILLSTAKAVSVPRGMDQSVPIPGTGTFNALIDVSHEDDGDAELSSTQSPTRSRPTSSTSTRPVSTVTSPRMHVANLAGVRGKGTDSSQPAKKAKTDRNLMDALDRMTKSNTVISISVLDFVILSNASIKFLSVLVFLVD